MKNREKEQIQKFFNQIDEKGESNLKKALERHHIIRRIETTDQNKSYEEVTENINGANPYFGVVEQDGRLIGFGIHIFNEDVYPLQSFEIYLRNCDLVGNLNLSHCTDMVFLDVYNNRISSIEAKNMKSMRIFGAQNNLLTELDPTELPVCQGIDVGKNKLKSLDVSKNTQLVELYINDNEFTEISLSNNPKLKYFYCHNNDITRLNTRNNPLLRHLNATGNPMTEILSLAPQREDVLPLELLAGEGGFVGLKFNPVYNAQWKETGEWQQSYYAYPKDGYEFAGWYDTMGNILSVESVWIDRYGESRVLKALFQKVN